MPNCVIKNFYTISESLNEECVPLGQVKVTENLFQIRLLDGSLVMSVPLDILAIQLAMLEPKLGQYIYNQGAADARTDVA